MARETVFDVPAITPGTRQAKAFDRSQQYPYPYRTRLDIENRNANATVLVYLNNLDPPRRIGPLLSVTIDIGSPIYAYSVDATSATSLGDVSVYENGGLDEHYLGDVPEPTTVQ